MKSFVRLRVLMAVVFFGIRAHAQSFQQIKYLNIDNGLSNNSVNFIFQDHYGFLWFGTNDGLNRYDGYNFKIFRNRWGDEASLINNHINSIAEDQDNRIWVGTEKGLVYYNYSDSKIYTVYYRPPHQVKLKKITSKINKVITDANGNVYIATDNAGLLMCLKGDTTCRQIIYLNNTLNYDVHNLTIDKQGKMWMFINGVGLCQYNSKLNKISLINNKLLAVSCIAPDDAHAFVWLGTENGLYKYDIANDEIINLSQTYKLSNKNIMQLHLDKTGQVWVATDGGGINIIDPNKNRVNYILPGETKGSLSSGSVYDIYEDRDSRIWVATLKGGINIIDYKNHPFKSISHDPLNKNSLVNNFTRSFCEDTDGNIWIGTAGGGLSYWNTKSNTYTNYTHNDAKPGSLSGNFVMSIVNNYQNKIWIATFDGGINLFNKSNHTFKHYTCFNTHTGIEDKNTWKLYEDTHHNLWAATTRNGALYLFNNQTDKFELFDYHLTNINCFYEDKVGGLWAGNNNQLIKIDRINKKHKYFFINSVIFSIHEDKAGRFWIGTDSGGLLLFNPKNQTYTRYTEANGLPNNTILDILEGNDGSIWFSTYNGLSQFNPNLKTVKNYYSSDGLQSNQFTYDAALKLKSGDLLFGGIKGFNLFNPDNIKPCINTPEIFLTAFRVNNVPVEDDPSFKKTKGIINMENIVLPYDKANISVDFAALEYTLSDKISYGYYLENWDHAWNNIGKIRTANYSRLNEGHYVLRIRSTNTDGAWSNNQRLIYITVLPPWFRTWWAYGIYALIVSVLIYYYLLYRSNQIKLKHEIEIAYIKADKETELNERKLAFFTNISHEFRTPLTLIINPIKDMLNDRKHGDNSDLNIVHRNARRLLSLVDQLLLFRKAESENDSLKIVKLNFVHLCNEVYLCFIHQAKIKNIQYVFECDTDNIELYADREKIEIAFFNLLSNALKFTPDGGRVTINVKQTDEVVNISITDTGCGVPANVGERLFEKFYKARNQNTVKTGFGIGLYLVKCFIDNHHGSISYHSVQDGGTTFSISLNKGKSHFGNSFVFEDITSGAVYLEELIEELPETQIDEPQSIISLDMMISDQQSMLVIDDNFEILEYIKRIFKPQYKLYEANNAIEGFKIIKDILPDIVISDIVMPDMSGIQLCKLIKEDTSLNHIPVILLTAELTPDVRLAGLEAGAYDCIGKPFEKDLLIARIHTILKNRGNLQTYFYNEVTLQSNNLKISNEHKDFLNKCISIVENYLTDDEFTIQILALELGMSRSNLFKKMKSISGQSLNGFVRFVRLRKAAELLINTNCNVNEAAYRVGLNDIKYFREQFHKLFGMNPSDFIKKHRVAFHKNHIVDDHLRSSRLQ
jgi:signal transduction histidine kinase/ligand-binding sensor domain-containing protein/DNA-binding response OmpR family regulator